MKWFPFFTLESMKIIFHAEYGYFHIPRGDTMLKLKIFEKFGIS